MRLGLFALTGFGNVILTALEENGLRPKLIVTRKERDVFPYYSEIELCDLSRDMGIPCFEGQRGEKLAESVKLDVILVGTYHRILSDKLLRSSKLNLNIHPSMLPQYRGANPFFWVLRNGETSTGVTIHQISKKIDEGAVFWASKLKIANTETQGSLRKRLAKLAACGAVELLSRILAGEKIEAIPQIESEATYFPKCSIEDRTIKASMTRAEIIRLMQAVTPFPGALWEGKAVKRVLDGPQVLASQLDEFWDTAEASSYRLTASDGDLLLVF